MRIAILRLAGHVGQVRRVCQSKCLSGFQSIRRVYFLASCSRDNLQDIPTKHFHLPNKRNGLISFLRFPFLQHGCDFVIAFNERLEICFHDLKYTAEGRKVSTAPFTVANTEWTEFDNGKSGKERKCLAYTIFWHVLF